ncbi:ATP/GTP-binding protein [Streptomyces coerulescens]|uniref:ATP/GTP-binding protein n=1 Tax=Streptomyces coerulescens TaxID=29304 RepID=A0ABW0CY49_STRCD
MLTRSTLLGAATATAFLLVAGAAQAADGPGNSNVDVGSCTVMEFCVGVGVDGSNGSQESSASANGINEQGGKGGEKDPDAPVCTVSKMDPPPLAGSDLWEGHDPDDGTVYTRICSSTDEFIGINVNTTVETFWAANPPPAVDPAVLAQQAVDKMTLLGPDININPKPGGKGLVGMPVWMAVDQSQTTWGPNTATASAGGVTVTATAKVSKVVWSMGDGSSVTCTTPGTVYQKSYGLKKSPDCGHVYTQPSRDATGGTYEVTATSTWVINWQGGGANGQLTEVRNSSVAVTIVESQAVNS